MDSATSFGGAARGDVHMVYLGQSEDDLIIQHMEDNGTNPFKHCHSAP